MMNGNNFLYEFGSYQLDERERVLTREGCILPLTPKAFETLLALVQNSGRVVKKGDLMKQVWPNTYVEEATSRRTSSRCEGYLVRALPSPST